MATGQWPHTHGLVQNAPPDQSYDRQRRNRARPRAARPGISDKQVLLDNLLFDRGYRLQHWGKWHLGDISELRCFAHKAGQQPDRIAYTGWRDQLGESVVTRMGEAMGEAGLREYLRCYYAQVTMVDEQFGRLLDKLHDLGLDDNTLVIFTSDHGDLQAAHGMMGKSAQTFYEEVVRVPLLVRYPPTIKPKQVLDLHANSVDLMPTILEYAGLPIPDSVQGRSLRPILDGHIPPDDRPAFCERGRDGRSAQRMIRTAEWKYCVYGDGRRELFNLTEDPGETKNLADDPTVQDHRKRLEAELRGWMRATNDPAMDDLLPSAG